MKLDGTTEATLARSLSALPRDERAWITFGEARLLFSTKSAQYAFGETDQDGIRNIESYGLIVFSASVNRFRAVLSHRTLLDEMFGTCVVCPANGTEKFAHPPRHLAAKRTCYGSLAADDLSRAVLCRYPDLQASAVAAARFDATWFLAATLPVYRNARKEVLGMRGTRGGPKPHAEVSGRALEYIEKHGSLLGFDSDTSLERLVLTRSAIELGLIAWHASIGKYDLTALGRERLAQYHHKLPLSRGWEQR